MTDRHGFIRMLTVVSGALLGSLGAAPASALQAAHPYAAAILDADATSGVVATAIRFPAGSAHDPRGAEGTAALLARVLENRLTEAARNVGASVRVEAGPDRTVVTFVAVQDRWAEAARRIVDALYDQVLGPVEVEVARDELVRILVFEAGAPVRDFEVELARFLYGELDDHARRSLGTPATVEGLRVADLEAFRSANLTPAGAVLAIVGPVDRTDVERVFGRGFDVLGSSTPGPATLPRGAAARATPPPPRLELYRTGAPDMEVPAAGMAAWAWDTGAREALDREVTSTWISVATPLPVGTPGILSEFLAHIVIEDLTPSPPDPGLYDANIEILQIRGAPVLVVTASVDPEATTRWEDRLYTVVGRMATQPPEGAFFELARRRFRSELVLDLAVPEDRARWLARQVVYEGEARSSPEGGVWAVTRESIAELAAAAGPSRVLLFGPAQMIGQ